MSLIFEATNAGGFVATKELGKLVEACLFLGVASNRLAATIQMPCGKGNENCEFIALIATQPFWAILSQHLKFNMDFGSLLEKTMQEVGKKSRWILFHQPRLAWSTGKGISHTHTHVPISIGVRSYGGAIFWLDWETFACFRPASPGHEPIASFFAGMDLKDHNLFSDLNSLKMMRHTHTHETVLEILIQWKHIQ